MVNPKVLRSISALKRALSPKVNALQDAAWSTMANERLPQSVRAGVASEATFGELAEPHDRRTFFRHALGLPAKSRQLRAMHDIPMVEEPDYALEALLSQADAGDPAAQESWGFHKAAAQRVADAGFYDGADATGADYSTIQRLVQQLQEQALPEPEPAPLSNSLDQLLRRLGVRKDPLPPPEDSAF